MTVCDVVVVGGGNLGLWTAHRLARRGFGRIAVLERGWGGATSRSAGVVCQQGGSETAAELARFSRERDPDRVEDTLALPFPKK